VTGAGSQRKSSGAFLAEGDTVARSHGNALEEDPDLKNVIWLALALTVLPATARGQETPAVPYDALQRLVSEQARRLEALEARLTALQTEVKDLRSQTALAPSPAAVAGVAPVTAGDQPPVEHATGGAAPPPGADPYAPEADLPSSRPIDGYGSLRLASVVNTDGVSDIRNNSSRIGLRGEKPLGGSLTAFARLELGVNLVNNDRSIIETGEPGAPIGRGSQPFFSRLGLIGLASPVGNVSWGKQWAPYYDVAEFTDQGQLFSGLASGAFGAGTDGGLAGTGRAERSVQYRERLGPVSVGLQVQNRATSPNDRNWLDTWGGSVIVGQAQGFGAGATYNEVRDGVENPNLNQTQLGDKAGLFGARYRNGGWYGAVTYSILKQHEVDDLGRRYDGKGFELALVSDFIGRTRVELIFNNLQPESNHPGDFRLRFLATNIVYQFDRASRVFAGVKFDGGRASDGTSRPAAVFAGGLRYNF
jgi:outer membrane protein N